MISLIGKTVKIDKGEPSKAILSSGLQLIQFFHPRFLIRNSLFFNQKSSIIFNSSSNRKANIITTLDRLSRETRKFILVVDIGASYYDYDFSKRTVLLDFVYSKWKLDYNTFLAPKELSYLESVSYFEFINYIKYCWMIGRPPYDFKNSVQAVSALVRSFEESEADATTAFFSLLNNNVHHNYIEECVLTWIEDNYSDINNKSLNLKHITTSLAKYRSMLERKVNKKMALLWLVKALAEEHRGMA